MSCAHQHNTTSHHNAHHGCHNTANISSSSRDLSFWNSLLINIAFLARLWPICHHRSCRFDLNEPQTHTHHQQPDDYSNGKLIGQGGISINSQSADFGLLRRVIRFVSLGGKHPAVNGTVRRQLLQSAVLYPVLA